ncbi:glutamate synthase large subunit [Rhodococcus sp. IEGM 1379]|uniref:glutamate synthase large subunit n=1 Tax=Rhodococcus sp. IEGM 1379 TaxID=3047086 RepID=UPI0024B71551|nr:glutamate synthase large subunit [Rhodococcus sp. IEGM 1379]MDI9915516.1 glutamate synthase large subunit [Rhodococcus sp. IEGM 1379]
MLFSQMPDPQGLYDPDQEADSCGVAVVADMYGRRSHSIVRDGLSILCSLSHRGAVAADSATGDGAGILLQLPVGLLDSVTSFELPVPNADGENMFAAGNCFLPQAAELRRVAVARIEQCARSDGLSVLGWRDVPVSPGVLGSSAAACAPHIAQCFLCDAHPDSRAGGIRLDRKVFALRKQVERDTSDGSGVYFCSLSSRTLVYKGMLTPTQLPLFFDDLRDERITSALALVHSRFSTNTFPSWPLAQPFRCIAHNGEFNTVVGNRNWMQAREPLLRSELFSGDVDRITPVCTVGASDSASFDEVLELLSLGGRSLPHAVMMMIPAAWEQDSTMSAELRAFYQFHACLMEAWDGPASVTFSDGKLVGAVLDRNGLRPGRWLRTRSGRIVLASESGVFDVPPADVVEKGRLEPGRMFLLDTDQQRIVPDSEIKAELARMAPYQAWLDAGMTRVGATPDQPRSRGDPDSVLRDQQVFGYTEEDLHLLLAPMAGDGCEALGSMGTDTPLAVLSERPRLLYDYFVQLFAQVTNPPSDAIREEVVTSLAVILGAERNLLEPSERSCRRMLVHRPVVSRAELDTIARRGITVLPGLFDVERAGGLADALEKLRADACAAVDAGCEILVISDRGWDRARAPIPSLLAVSSVHHHLVRMRRRASVSLIVESGDAREVHHLALLLGYGAAAVHPYLALESVEQLSSRGELPGVDPDVAVAHYLDAANRGVLKVMSKMGISVVQSYTGAKVFEAIGLSRKLVGEHFGNTASKLGGVGIAELAREVATRHARVNADPPMGPKRLEAGGEYRYRRGGEAHVFTPESVFFLQHATRSGRSDVFRRYTEEVDRRCAEGGTLRGMLDFRRGLRPAVSIEDVESAESILSRFSTGAMSYGSLSAEAHETMAKAMNSMGARSNSGEGGEDQDRLHDPLRRSAVKQVASGRFGVTSDYLISATDIQIKMAQGAKPGEGGQLPGYKVYPWIARTRYSTPGVGLISPPQHHDIYSIEDLAQLIYDLRQANNRARIHVKLVSAVGVGTVAAGVAKAHADVVLISGHDGGTGAAALTSIKHAGTPWELGLAETQQTLVLNGLRDRITLQCDGGMRTARDVVVAALLGAQEYGFSTAPLIAAGCVMMRVCHLDTCPVGVATQDPELRARFTGRPEFVENFFRFLADDVREYLASLGFRSIDEAIGRSDMLVACGHGGWKSRTLDMSPLMVVPRSPKPLSGGLGRPGAGELNQMLVDRAAGALDDAERVRIELPVGTADRAVGTALGAEVSRRYGAPGLPDNTIVARLTGTAGQSLGAFLPSGITLEVIGDANDYVGKGLSGGRIVLRPSFDARFCAEEQVIAGNTVLYGATSGEFFARGRVGERFAVRNSGARAVVEGTGDHACEYMTGGRVVILGPTGRNVAAGMSGGIAFVLDADPRDVNHAMVTLQVPTADDLRWMQNTIATHVELTGSPVGARLLAEWARESRRFTKLMPVDYERVLAGQSVATPPRDGAVVENSDGVLAETASA